MNGWKCATCFADFATPEQANNCHYHNHIDEKIQSAYERGYAESAATTKEMAKQYNDWSQLNHKLDTVIKHLQEITGVHFK